ncbi:hypothetical protein [Leifsonia xyli]|uniref:hypothetical protein n=1 Tax=Leifsonia xyli TaxID=1575 RepID=UPI003D66D6FC
MSDYGWGQAEQARDDLASVIEGIGKGLDGLVHGAQEAIDELVHNAAVGLLHALLPPMVHGKNAMVRSGAWVRTEALTAEILLALGSAKANNALLAGLVAGKVDEGVDHILSHSDYTHGVNSIT